MQETTDTFDIFHWANNTDGSKNELDVELFLFNKNYTPYSIRLGSDLNYQLKPFFLYDVINFVQLGAGTGLSVREMSSEEGERENVLLHIPLADVGRAETLLYLIENERDDIVEFDSRIHEFKNIKGVVARFTHPVDKGINFYVPKLIKRSEAISDGTPWQLTESTFSLLKPDVAVKMPADNQMLAVGNNLFVFNASKFTQLFNHDARAIEKAEQIGKQVDETYKLSMPTIGQGIAFMARQKPVLMKKLLAVEPGLITQEQAIEIADDIQVELMVGDNGEIILMDYDDVGVFLDILLDNYIHSEATGNNYQIKNKKQLPQGDA